MFPILVTQKRAEQGFPHDALPVTNEFVGETKHIVQFNVITEDRKVSNVKSRTLILSLRTIRTVSFLKCVHHSAALRSLRLRFQLGYKR
jgi:hypothetical protein